MTSFVEGNLEIKLLKDGWTIRKFDDEDSHGLTHCMKAIDFIIEANDCIYFIEFKDVDNPNTRPEGRQAFLESVKSNKFRSDLKTKCRDTWLYQYGSDRIRKPIHYLVLFEYKQLDKALRSNLIDQLPKHIPITGPNSQPWKKPFIDGCTILNLADWNKHFSELFPVSRITESGV